MAIGQLPEADLEGSEEAIFAEINITPLTDVILVVLIIFMVASSASIETAEKAQAQAEEAVAAAEKTGLKVNLPSGEAKELDEDAPSLVITILKSGQVSINDEIVDPSVLQTVFQNAYVRNKLTQVVLRADKGVAHGRVVSVMEQAKRVGLTRLAISTSG